MEGGGKCSALCQHPGCWYAGSKLREVPKWPSGYAHYLAELTAPKKLCITEDSSARDAHVRSYTVDGLPTLKVQTLTQQGINEHNVRTRSSTSPVPLQTIHSQHAKTANQPLILPKVTYAQILLEEEDYECFEAQDEIVLKRVLIWRPGLRKHLQAARTTAHELGRGSSSIDAASHECKRLSVRDDGKTHKPSGTVASMEPSSTAMRSSRTVMGADKSSRTLVRPDGSTVRDDKQTAGQQDLSSHETSKSPLKVYRTNLTDTLPPYNERRKPKTSASLQQWKFKGNSSLDAVSLSYLGDINLPPQVVEEILQQLRSESTSNTDIDLHGLTQTPALNHLSSKLLQKPTPTSMHRSYAAASDHQQCDLSSKRVRNISASGLSAAAQRRFSQMTSFSRGLSIQPVDVLKVHSSNQRAKISDQLYNRKSDGWREMGGDISGQVGLHTTDTEGSWPALRNHQLTPPTLHATGGVSYLHSRNEVRGGGRSYPTPHSEYAQQASSHKNDIKIPVQTTNITTKPPRTITLSLDPASQHSFPSQRNNDIKVAPRFVSVPKARYLPKCSHPQSSYTEDDLTSSSYTPLLAQGQQSRLSSSHSAALKHPALQRLMCPSPDYMMVAAKFAEGQLILTDKEGLVTQHLTTEVESDTNIEPSESPKKECEPEKAAGPPPSVQQLQGSGSKPEMSAKPDRSSRQEEEELPKVPAGSRAPPTSAMEGVKRL